jgi:hypothetical protein
LAGRQALVFIRVHDRYLLEISPQLTKIM